MARRAPPPKLTVGTLRHFAAAAVGLTICIALFAGDSSQGVEDAAIEARHAMHKAEKLASNGNQKVAKTGGGMIISAVTRRGSQQTDSGGWGGAAGPSGAGPSPSDAGGGGGGGMTAPASMPPGPGQMGEWEGGANILPEGHPGNLARNPEQSQAAGGPRNRKKDPPRPSSEQMNKILEASRLRAAARGV